LNSFEREITEKRVIAVEADVSQNWDSWVEKIPDLNSLKFVFHFASPASPPLPSPSMLLHGRWW
jgi:hypothetical protein